MSDDLIERLKAATEGTTPGPWSFGRTGDEQRMILGGSSGNYVANVQIYQTPRHMGQWQEPEREANARFIAAARELVPAMRARIEADAKRIAEAVKLLDERDREYNRLTNEMIERHAARTMSLAAENDRLRRTISAAFKLGRIVGFLGEDEGRIEAFCEECGPELLAIARAALEGEKT